MTLNLMCDVRKEGQLICTKAVDIFGVMCVKVTETSNSYCYHFDMLLISSISYDFYSHTSDVKCLYFIKVENFLSIAGMDDYSCYFCTYGSNTIDIVIEHNITEHLDKDLKIKRKIFTEDSGQFAYRAVHFPRTVFSLKQQLDRGFKWVVDIETKSVRYKRVKKRSKYCRRPGY